MAVRRDCSIIGILISSLGAGFACSAPPGSGEDADTVPEFRGNAPVVAQVTPQGAPAASNPSSGNPPASNSTGASTPEVIGNQPLPVDTSGSNNSGSNNSGSSNAGAGGSASVPANGTAGSASVPSEMPANPGNGAGGSAMPSAAGGGNLPPMGNGSTDNGQQQPPPVVNPPPVTPPPVVTPPPSNPGPVGTGCAPGAAFFCEDFEDLAVGTARATDTWRPEGTVSIDGQTAQGARSLKLQPNGGQFARIVLSSFAPPNNSFFGRMKVFVQQFPVAPAYSHFVFVEVTGNGGEHVRPLGGQFIPEGAGPSTYWGVGSDAGATGDWTKWEPRVRTENGRWICMEWQMSAADNSVHVFIDGTERTELGVSTNSHGGGGSPFVFPTFNNIWLGWWNFQGGTTPAQFNIWLDDIVLSSQRVGCN